MSLANYLEFEETSNGKHEFVDGLVFAMAGASNNHNLISTNLVSLLRPATRANACRLYASDMKLRTPNNNVYYPDILITCDPKDFASNTKTTACLIVEILSDSTANIDRDEKLYNYRQLPKLKAYVMLSQKHMRAEIYRRNADGSWSYEVVEEGEVLLPCVDAELKLEGIYEDIELSSKA